jgi:transcriptional regulator GlxA family with amidase domain
VEIAVLLYDGVDSAEALGPAQVLGRLPGARLWFVAADPGIKDGHNPPLHLHAAHAVTQLPRPDALIVPGGFGCLQLIDDRGLVDWVREAQTSSGRTLAVSTGPVLLAVAGLLRGRRATGHWLTSERLRANGAEPVHDRIVDEGGIATAVGAAAAMDLALRWVSAELGEAAAASIRADLELGIDPRFDTTVPGAASALVRRWNEDLQARDVDAGRADDDRRSRWPHRRPPRRVVTAPGDENL